MSQVDAIRAWKDEEYRNSLTAAERAQLPESPVGLIEIADEDLTSVVGGVACTYCCCICPITPCCGGTVACCETPVDQINRSV